MKTFDPSSTYVRLSPEGTAEPLDGGTAFWTRPPNELDAIGQDWLVTEFGCSEDGPHWELHPHGDEFVYLLSGRATFQLELPDGVRSVPLEDRGALLVPRGVWHTAKVTTPSRMLFVTRGEGTQHRS